MRSVLVVAIFLLGVGASARELTALPPCTVPTGQPFPYTYQCRKNRRDVCQCTSGTCSVGSSANTYCSGAPPTCNESNMRLGNLYCRLNGQEKCRCPGGQTCSGGSWANKYCEGGASTCTSSYTLAQGQFWEGYMGLLSPVDYDPAINTAEACACKCDQTAGCDIWALPNGVDIGEEVDGCWSLAWDPIEPADPNPDICYGVGQLTIGIKSSYNPTLLDCTQQ